MEHKFGIFNTVEDLNRAAAAQKAEGDEEALMALALENGLDEEDARDYLEGEAENLCTPYMAALGKLDLEAAELKLKSELKDWTDFLAQLLGEYPGDDLCHGVFRPDKKLIDVLARGLKKASDNRIKVDARIIKAAGLPSSAAYMGMCGRDELTRIMLDYYLDQNGEKPDGNRLSAQ